MRSIIHFRLNSFFAALEQTRRPDLAGKPVLVTRKSGRGDFVASASVECRPSLLRQELNSCPNSGLTVRHALRYCPTAVVIPADWGYYREKSEAVMDILSKYSPRLEPDSLDKAYMDVTGCTKLFGSPKRIAREAQRRVADEIGVRMSVGIARNKLVASAVSSACKPDGCMAVRPGTEAEFMSKLQVGVLSGVGPKIEKRLQGLGVRTVGELAAIPERLLVRQFGALGSRLRTQSQGIDHSPVAALYPQPVIIVEHTFECDDDDASDPGVVEAYLLRLCEQSAIQMRKRDQQTGSLKLSLDYDGVTENRFYTFKTPVSTARDIYVGARRTLLRMVDSEQNIFPPEPLPQVEGGSMGFPPPLEGRGQREGLAAVSSLRLTLSDLQTGSGIQLSLIGDTELRMRLDSVLETIRSRFGDRAIACGAA